MELRNIRTFVEAARTLHFGEAAQQVHITQPALSRQIQKLEAELGVQLFDRKGHGVVLTHAGRAFLEEAVKILERVDRAVERTQRVGRGMAGIVRIGFVASLTFSLIPELIRQLKKKAPDIRLELQELGTAQQLAAIYGDTLDVGLVRPPIDREEGIRSRHVLSERIVAVLHSKHPLTEKQELEVFDLSAEPFVMYPRDMGPGLFDRIISICHRAGFSPKVVQEAGLVPTVVGLVSGGIGVALVPETVKYFGAASVEFRPLRDSEAVTELIAVWRKDRMTPLLDTLLTCLDSCAREFE